MERKTSIQLAFIIITMLVLPGLSYCSKLKFSQEDTEFPEKRFQTTIITDEAEAVFSILEKIKNSQVLNQPDWDRLFSTEGYLRLKKREHSMQRRFDDTAFKSFVLNKELLEKMPELKKTLQLWKQMDLKKAAKKAFDYLPEDAVIKVKIYPVIKKAPNSFVFETNTDNPAIFFYMNTDVKAEELENTIAHELHHIGVGNVGKLGKADSTVPMNVKRTLGWMGGFSEGRAMLAAAGGPLTDPHKLSDSAKRAVWYRDLANAAADMKNMEEFFLRLLDGKIAESDEFKEGMKFIVSDTVPQGPFYTVGWLMASEVEKKFGRQRLIDTINDPLAFISDYNIAASETNGSERQNLPLWSVEFLNRISQLKKYN